MREARGQEKQPSYLVERGCHANALYVEKKQQTTQNGSQQIIYKSLLNEFHGCKDIK